MVQSDKVALVTGASRGIGFSIALELARMGYALGIVSRSREEIERAGQEIAENVRDARIITGAFDIADEKSVESFVKEVRDRSGPASVLVNNAGEYTLGTSGISLSDAQRMLEVNYLSAVRFIQAVVPEMKKCMSGYIINIASICGVTGFADVGAYCASKFAMVGYSEALGRELEPSGIRVTALCPSWVNTRMAMRSPVAPDQMIQPEDMGSTVRFLLSLSSGVRVRQIVLDCE